MNFFVINKSENAVLNITAASGEFYLLKPLEGCVIKSESEDLTFTVRYINDFSFGYKTKEEQSNLKNKIINKSAEALFSSIDKAVLQIEVTFNVTSSSDKAVIELYDKYYYVITNEIDRFFKCLPVVCYLPFIKKQECEIQFICVSSHNRSDFIKFYKQLFRIINIRYFFFRFIRYLYQIKRHIRLSQSKNINKILYRIFQLPSDEAEKEFSATNAFSKQFFNILDEKIPGFILKRLIKKGF